MAVVAATTDQIGPAMNAAPAEPVGSTRPIILAHELAHVSRHDFLANLLQTLVETLFFYHPAVWWLSHRIRVERENCCDDLAVAALGNRVEYGRALLALEELRGTTTVLALGVRSGPLLDRVRRLLGRDPAERSVGAGSVVGVGLANGNDWCR